MKSRTWQVAEAPAVWYAGGDLPDLNVWVALTGSLHPHHAAAKRYWEESLSRRNQEQRIYFCRTTMLGLVRLLSQPKLMGDAVQTVPAAHAIYRHLRESVGVGFQSDLETADLVLSQWLAPSAKPLTSKLWTDAWLAALAEASGLRLVSFDRGIQRFPLTRSLLLGAS